MTVYKQETKLQYNAFQLELDVVKHNVKISMVEFDA